MLRNDPIPVPFASFFRSFPFCLCLCLSLSAFSSSFLYMNKKIFLFLYSHPFSFSYRSELVDERPSERFDATHTYVEHFSLLSLLSLCLFSFTSPRVCFTHTSTYIHPIRLKLIAYVHTCHYSLYCKTNIKKRRRSRLSEIVYQSVSSSR
jgi:hypothetical protein